MNVENCIYHLLRKVTLETVETVFNTLQQQVITNRLVEKLSSGCDQNCRNEKKRTLEKVEMAREAIERKLTGDEAEYKKRLKYLKKASEAIQRLSDVTGNLMEFRNDPENHRRNLLEKIDYAYNVDKLLSLTENEEMKKEIGDTASYDEEALNKIKRRVQEKEEIIRRAEEKASQNASKTRNIRLKTKKDFRLSFGLKMSILVSHLSCFAT